MLKFTKRGIIKTLILLAVLAASAVAGTYGVRRAQQKAFEVGLRAGFGVGLRIGAGLCGIEAEPAPAPQGKDAKDL